ncbi:BREX-2 system phosphatase PglZ [Nonomuraea sp. NPDC048892]|uniref:BREX-2 system phosphatase PglZ n=1 Tax=Nonomuraea sp. NPDC048892 TaxID=3154624 RepID=UPI0033C6D7C4
MTPARTLLPITPAALEQEIARLLRKYAARDERVLLIRAEPSWTGQDEITSDGRRVTIAGCVSPLAILEQVTDHLERSDDSMLVVLTPVEESDLGPGLLSRVVRQRVFVIEPWQVVEESFGAQQIDPRLIVEGWAAEALINAMPWPRLTGTILTRDVALRHLAAKRLGMDQFGVEPDDLGAPALLLWSADAGAVEAFQQLREDERTGLIAWLRERVGRTADVLFRLVDGGKAGDALALGLVCAALWNPEAADVAARPQGAVLAYISTMGGSSMEDSLIKGFASDTEMIVGWLLRGRSTAEETHLAHAVLDRAEELIIQFGARSVARFSALLRSGFEDRLSDVAELLSAALDSPRGNAALALAVARLRDHALADTHAHRVRRAEMAQRLIQWLATPYDPAVRVSGVGVAVQAQIDEWGWVDRARDDIWAGEHLNEPLKQAYGMLHGLVAERTRGLNEAFAAKLAAWAAAGPGDALTVETVLPRVVAPLVADKSGRPILLVVLDGMSAAVACELAEELRGQRWEEYDAVGGGTPRRRAIVAALPTLTKVSRASLFAAHLTTGRQEDERSAFEAHPFWHGKKVRLFHKGTLPGEAGEALSEDLTAALGDPTVHVAVVLNAIDDTLDKGPQSADSAWQIKDIGILRTLLDYARFQGRAVILTSDHGHVLERSGSLRSVTGVESGRHRTALPPVTAGEVELSGPRVIADNNRIIALWDPYLHYGPKKAGYHGGASLAEVTIPLLAFLPLGAAVPEGWRALSEQQPNWWSLRPAPAAPAAPPKTARGKSRKSAGPNLAEPVEALFDVAPVPETAPSPVEELLATELFEAQHRLMPRKVPTDKIGAVLQALLDAGGPLPLPVIAETAGEPPVRAAGFVATLQRILNIDNYAVLSIVDNGRSVRLDVHLLREQFGLKGR